MKRRNEEELGGVKKNKEKLGGFRKDKKEEKFGRISNKRKR